MQLWGWLLSQRKPPESILPGNLLLAPAVLHAPLLCSLQISPQIYQSLHFSELASTQNPAFKTQKVLDQQSWLTLLVTQRIRKDLGPYRDTVPEHPASSPTTTASSPSSPSLSASGSGLLASGLAPSSWSQPSRSFL